MNEYEAQRIAAAINVLRPDWPTKSLVTLMQRPELAHRPRRDIAVALTWVACETNSATPARVLEAGPWWRAAVVDAPERSPRMHPPKRHEECKIHAGQWADNCGGCRTDQLAVRDNGDDEPTPRTESHADASLARALMAQTRANLCGCGVRRGLCPVHRDEEEV